MQPQFACRGEAFPVRFVVPFQLRYFSQSPQLMLAAGVLQSGDRPRSRPLDVRTTTNFKAGSRRKFNGGWVLCYGQWMLMVPRTSNLRQPQQLAVKHERSVTVATTAWHTIQPASIAWHRYNTQIATTAWHTILILIQYNTEPVP